MFTPDFHRIGGYERQALSLSMHLKKLGLDVFILSNNPLKLPAKEEIEGIEILRLKAIPFAEPSWLTEHNAAFLGLARLRRRFDILHAHALNRMSLSAVLAARLLGKKTLIKVASEKDFVDFIGSPLQHDAIFRKLLHACDRYVSLNDNITGEFLSAGILKNKIIDMTNGVDTECFKPSPAEERPRLKKNLGLAGTPLIVFVGRLIATKDVDSLLRAFPLVLQKMPEAVLVIIGDGPKRLELDELSRQSSAKNNILFTGEQQNIAPYLQAADVFAFPSLVEGNPNALLEAMACGLACVACDIAGVKRVISENMGEGVKVPAGDFKALANGIISAFARRNELGAAARKKALDDFSFDKLGQKYLRIYEELLAS
jgi:glycosyltransferase involved in cell wall biosynthesis